MQKWEYRMIHVDTTGFGDTQTSLVYYDSEYHGQKPAYMGNTYKTTTLLGKEIEKTERIEFITYSKTMGAEGWEMVGFGPVITGMEGTFSSVTVTFKRPIEE